MSDLRTIELHGEPLRVALDGPADAPLILLANSIGTSLELWDAQLPALTERFRVLRYNARGHHPMSRAGGDFSLDTLGLDALGLLDAVGARTARVAGISLGGAVAQWLLLHAPERIERAVIANSAAWFGPPEKWQVRIDAVRAGGTAAVAAASVERWFTPRFKATEAGTVERVRQQLLATPPAAYIGCGAALRDLDLRGDIARIDKPVLVIGGLHDAATPIDDSRAMAAAIQGAQLPELDAAHLSNVEQHAAFNAALVDFFTAAH